MSCTQMMLFLPARDVALNSLDNEEPLVSRVPTTGSHVMSLSIFWYLLISFDVPLPIVYPYLLSRDIVFQLRYMYLHARSTAGFVQDFLHALFNLFMSHTL